MPILKEPPLTLREAFIPYLMAGLNMLAPTLAVSPILYKPEIRLWAIAFILLGVPCSVYFRQRQYNRIVLNLITMVPLLTVTWALTKGHPGLQIDWNNLAGWMMSHDGWDQLEGMLHVFVLLSAGRAFLLVTTRDLVQTPLPGISIFLLLAVLNREAAGKDFFTLCCLLVFLATGLYIFSQDHTQQWYAISTPLRVQRRIIAWVVLFSVILFPVTLSLGMTLERYNMTALAVARRQHFQGFRMPFTSGGQFGIGFEDSVDLMGDGWPNDNQAMMDVRLSRKAPQFLLWRSGSYTTYENGQWQRQHRFARGRTPADFLRSLRNRAGLRGRSDWSVVGGGRQPYYLRIPVDGDICDPGVQEAIREKKIILPIDPQTHQVKADERTTVFQRFTFSAKLLGRTAAPIFGAYQVWLGQSVDEQFARLQVRSDGTILIPNPIAGSSMSTYDILSIIKPMPTLLRLNKKVELDPTDRAEYLQMPAENQFASRIRKKAIAILVEGGLTPKSDPYDITRRFENYLGQHYQYTLTPRRPKNGADPIVDFLYTQKQGYCNYFSGTMVMLCRSMGIPARFVVGFATGEQDETQNLQHTDYVDYHVRAKDAHSWVEVFLPRYGWYTSDPTAGSTLAPTLWGSTWDVVIQFVTSIKNGIVALVTSYRTDARVNTYLKFAFALILVLAAGIVYWRQERPPSYPKKPLTAKETRSLILTAYQQMHRWLGMWGVVKPDGLTAQEFAQRFIEINPRLGELVREVTRLYVKEEYSGIELTDDDGRHMVDIMRQLWEVARIERKQLQVRQTDFDTL